MATTALRPAPPDWKPPAGREWAAVPDEQWRVATPEDAVRTCRYRLCRGTPVAALNRGMWTSHHGKVDSWWLYCDQHLYGRWVEDGQVMAWRAVAG